MMLTEIDAEAPVPQRTIAAKVFRYGRTAPTKNDGSWTVGRISARELRALGSLLDRLFPAIHDAEFEEIVSLLDRADDTWNGMLATARVSSCSALADAAADRGPLDLAATAEEASFVQVDPQGLRYERRSGKKSWSVVPLRAIRGLDGGGALWQRRWRRPDHTD